MKKSTLEVWQDGLISGVIGYASIAAYFAVLNLLDGRSPWFTLGTLGHAFFGSGSPGPLIAFNGLHLFVFLALGVVATFMIQEIEQHPAFWYAVFFVFVAGFIFGYLVLLVLTGALAGTSPLTLAFGNLIAALAMGLYLFWRHPGLLPAVRGEAERDEHPLAI